mmetsp:Transcript_15569/g.37911  ORF Transcript_15569/g.37911 Transcript_15569/m.37911 type:complete len:252 (-) Transcript_15569:709-1464(-)
MRLLDGLTENFPGISLILSAREDQSVLDVTRPLCLKGFLEQPFPHLPLRAFHACRVSFPPEHRLTRLCTFFCCDDSPPCCLPKATDGLLQVSAKPPSAILISQAQRIQRLCMAILGSSLKPHQSCSLNVRRCAAMPRGLHLSRRRGWSVLVATQRLSAFRSVWVYSDRCPFMLLHLCASSVILNSSCSRRFGIRNLPLPWLSGVPRVLHALLLILTLTRRVLLVQFQCQPVLRPRVVFESRSCEQVYGLRL